MGSMSIKSRLAWLVGVLLFLLLGAAYQSIHHVRNAQGTLHALYNDRVVPLKQLKLVADGYAVGVVDAVHKVRDGGFTAEQGIMAVTEARAVIEREWKAYAATDLVAQEKALIEKGTPLLKLADAAALEAATLMKGSDRGPLTDFAAKRLYPAIDPIGDVVSALIQVQLDVAAQHYQQSEATATRVLWVNSVTALAVLLLAGGVAWWMVRSIVLPLQQAVKVAETVAAGDLSSQIEVRGNDETGQLLAALARMNKSLVGIVGEVRSSSDSIATGSAEIANGNTDLSQRTEEQAANLQQTAASMEELTATVRQNADTSRAACDLADRASAAAVQGGEVVASVVQTMGEISDSARRIADISGVIDGIAFQTNLLALNAAVEAARAGDQGRGFAVVAGEVRTLAQRSAQAAREIRQLTSASVERTEAGSQRAGNAGAAMDDIVGQVRRVSELLREISSASEQQSEGIGQVGDAVAQLDQVTQQNAALVEESAAAAESLKHQAARMTDVVARFRLA